MYLSNRTRVRVHEASRLSADGAARAFDVTRYLLPLAAQGNVRTVVIGRWKADYAPLVSQLPELRAIGG